MKTKWVYWTNETYHEGMEYTALRKLRGNPTERSVDYAMEGKNLRISSKQKVVYFLGNKSFIKTEERAWFSYKGGRFYGGEPSSVFVTLPTEVRTIVLENLELSWMKDMSESLFRYATKKNIFKSILTHSIYNQETLVKAIAKRIFKLPDDFPWKVLRDFITTDQGFSIWDLRCFTKDLENSMKYLIKLPTNYANIEAREERSLINDMLHMAADENSIIDLSWSKKRKLEEHLKQIERARAEELESTTETPFYTRAEITALTSPSIHILKNEREVFMEGADMHHCLYNTYFHQIKQYGYVAFHMTKPEDCTFGVISDGPQILLDQIYLKYDRPVQPETRKIAENFIEKNEVVLRQIFEKYNPRFSTEEIEIAEDLPF